MFMDDEFEEIEFEENEEKQSGGVRGLISGFMKKIDPCYDEEEYVGEDDDFSTC